MRKSVLCLLLAMSLAYFFYTEVPEGWSQPWEVRLRLGTMRLVFQLGTWMEHFGIGKALVVRRIMSEIAKPVVTLGVRTSHLKEVANSTDIDLAGVSVRLFLPTLSGAAASRGHVHRPGIVYLHGGGWAMGDVDLYDSHVRRLVRDTGAVAISVNYRLAPEHPYPEPLDDCVAATKHFITNAWQYGVDPNRILVMGDSAGGNLAAATSLRLRDENFSPQPKMQVLIYPVLQMINYNSPSYLYSYISRNFLPTREALIYYYLYYAFGHDHYYHEFADTLHVPRAIMDEIVNEYMPLDILPHDSAFEEFKEKTQPDTSELWDVIKEKILDPYLCPLMAKDLTKLPMTYITVAQNDVIRDEGLWYGNRLKNAGVNVHVDLFKIGFHSWQIFSEDLIESDQNLVKLTDFINKYL